MTAIGFAWLATLTMEKVMMMKMRIEEMEKLIINDMSKVDISLIIFSLRC
jgi:hypothetical protein